jgi:hypothetical protein
MSICWGTDTLHEGKSVQFELKRMFIVLQAQAHHNFQAELTRKASIS